MLICLEIFTSSDEDLSTSWSAQSQKCNKVEACQSRRQIFKSITFTLFTDLWKCEDGHIDVDSEGTIIRLTREQLSSIILVHLQDLTVLKMDNFFIQI